MTLLFESNEPFCQVLYKKYPYVCIPQLFLIRSFNKLVRNISITSLQTAFLLVGEDNFENSIFEIMVPLVPTIIDPAIGKLQSISVLITTEKN
jgi:hypothetical protein